MFRDSTGDVVIHFGLERLLKIFNPNHEIWVELVKPPDDLQLIEVVTVTGMRLANENYALGFELRGKFAGRESGVQIDGA